MSSKRRIQSSRANGAKSHGPVTPEGKLKSSGNSLRHGLLSNLVVLDDERPDTFADLLAGLMSEFNPQTPAQRLLVETMAVARWRLVRIWAIERETLQSEIEKQYSQTLPPASRAARAFGNLANQSRTLDLLHRYEIRFDRQFSRSLTLFLKLAIHEDPENQFRQTTPSGAGLPACASAEGAEESSPLPNPAPTNPTPPPPPENSITQTPTNPENSPNSHPENPITHPDSPPAVPFPLETDPQHAI